MDYSTPKWLERTELLITAERLEVLSKLNVLIVGLGGVGSFAAEFVARAGIGRLTIADGDVVDITNTNRQLPATHKTVGMGKAAWMEQRIRDINPDIELTAINKFIGPEETVELVNTHKFDYVMDCIDSISPKVYLIKAAVEAGSKVISSMGAGGKIDSTKLKYADIARTHLCPFAQLVRKRLRYVGVHTGVMTVYSDEQPIKESIKETDGSNYKKSFYGTISYIPALFGLNMASWVIRDACGLFVPTPMCMPKVPKQKKP